MGDCEGLSKVVRHLPGTQGHPGNWSGGLDGHHQATGCDAGVIEIQLSWIVSGQIPGLTSLPFVDTWTQTKTELDIVYYAFCEKLEVPTVSYLPSGQCPPSEKVLQVEVWTRTRSALWWQGSRQQQGSCCSLFDYADRGCPRAFPNQRKRKAEKNPTWEESFWKLS